MNVFITGAAGFVGRHLAAELRRAGHDVCGLCLPDERPPVDVACAKGSVTDPAAVADAIERFRPNACVHLAGVSSVPAAWRDPAATCEVNLIGTIRLLDAVRNRAPSARVLVVSSSQIYSGMPGDGPLDEETPPRPDSPYSISKAAADAAALAYAHRFDLAIMTARPANHIGPGQAQHFVISSLAAQLAARRLGRTLPDAPVRAGNLDSLRDFMDVRDTVRGYRLLLEHGRAGLAYHLASGRLYRIGDLWERLCKIAGLRPPIETDPSLWRPADRSPVLSCERILRDTGWRPEIDIETTLRDIYDDAVARMSES